MEHRTSVVILSPKPVHPGGITRAIESWLAAGLEELVHLRQIFVADWDAPLPVQLAQTARAYAVLLATLVASRPKPDVVHIHVSIGPGLYREWLSAVLARLFRVPVVSHLHSGRFTEWTASARRRRWFARSLLRRSRIVVVPAAVWVATASRLGARDVRVVPHGLDAHLLTELATAAKTITRIAPRGPAVLLYYGRWAKVKGLDILGEAIRGLDADDRSRLVLRIFGNGDRRWLERCFAGANGADVHISGWLPDDEKARQLSSADAFVLPSRQELFAQALLEAMAAGIPIIATRTGGIPEVLNGYPGAKLVAPDDPAALRTALEELLDGRWPTRRDRASNALAPRFLAPSVVGELASIYRAAAETR
jgi:glycosyltransferase involved in cell wall biosynthesis